MSSGKVVSGGAPIQGELYISQNHVRWNNNFFIIFFKIVLNFEKNCFSFKGIYKDTKTNPGQVVNHDIIVKNIKRKLMFICFHWLFFYIIDSLKFLSHQSSRCNKRQQSGQAKTKPWHPRWNQLWTRKTCRPHWCCSLMTSACICCINSQTYVYCHGFSTFLNMCLFSIKICGMCWIIIGEPLLIQITCVRFFTLIIFFLLTKTYFWNCSCCWICSSITNSTRIRWYFNIEIIKFFK